MQEREGEISHGWNECEKEREGESSYGWNVRENEDSEGSGEAVKDRWNVHN